MDAVSKIERAMLMATYCAAAPPDVAALWPERVRGWVKLHPDTTSRKHLAAAAKLILGGAGAPLLVYRYYFHTIARRRRPHRVTDETVAGCCGPVVAYTGSLDDATSSGAQF